MLPLLRGALLCSRAAGLPSSIAASSRAVAPSAAAVLLEPSEHEINSRSSAPSCEAGPSGRSWEQSLRHFARSVRKPEAQPPPPPPHKPRRQTSWGAIEEPPPRKQNHHSQNQQPHPRQHPHGASWGDADGHPNPRHNNHNHKDNNRSRNQTPHPDGTTTNLPAVITARIAAARSPADLQDILHAHRAHLNCIHLSAGFTRLAKLTSTPTKSSPQIADTSPQITTRSTTIDAHLALARQILATLAAALHADTTKTGNTSDVGIREIANVVWACGKLPPAVPVPPAFVDHLRTLLLSHDDHHLARATPQHLCSLTYGFARLGCRQPELWAPLLAAATAKLPDFTPRQHTTLLWSLAKAGLHQHPVAARTMDTIAANFRQLDHKSYMHLAWALAEINPAGHRLPAMLVEACAGPRKIKLLDPQAIGQAVRLAAKIQVQDADVVHRLMTAVLRMPELYSPPELAAVVWAAAALQYADEPTFAKLIECTVAVAPRLEARELTLLAASLAKAGHLPPRVPATAMEPVLAALGPQVAKLTAMDAASLLTALGKMQYRSNEELLGAVAQRAVALVPEMNAQMLANTLWACAVLDFKPEELLGAMGGALQQEQLQLSGQSLAMTWWAAANLYPVDSGVFDRLLVLARENVSTLQAMDLVQLVYALAKIHATDKELYASLEQHTSEKLGHFDGQMVVNIARSFRHAGVLNSDFVRKVLEHKNEHQARWGQEDLESLDVLLKRMT